MGWKTSIGYNAGHSSYQAELHAISAFPSGHLRLVFEHSHWSFIYGLLIGQNKLENPLKSNYGEKLFRYVAENRYEPASTENIPKFQARNSLVFQFITFFSLYFVISSLSRFNNRF